VNLFQVWKVYQRRAESIAYYFDTRIIYYHSPWEERSKLHKAVSYIFKSIKTAKDLVKYRPKLVFIQLPPTPALYIVGAYCLATGTPYIADCHNAMFLEWWIKWPFSKSLLRRASAVLVHNNDVRAYAERYGVQAMVIRDPLPQRENMPGVDALERFGLTAGSYVIVPWNLATDEPIAEFIEAVRSLPDIKFAMTWFTERLPEVLRHDLPPNLVFTGYLEVDEFNNLFATAGAAISLTTQKGTQPSAAAEAVAFGVPIILSDTETARLLYRDVPVFVENSPQSISEGISEVFSKMASYRQKVADYKSTLNRELEAEVGVLKARLG
jgi:glycosyltransferase involved in cell wall biosynthesis